VSSGVILLKNYTVQLALRKKYIFRIFDEVFDLQNSRNPLGKFTKEPMRLQNKERWSAAMLKAEMYIRSLTSCDGQKIIAGRRRTGFLGFLSNMQAYKQMFNQLVEHGHLKYLLTYKTSQDHLELFFGAVRSRNGCNNNPTPVQFCSAYKRLLMHGISKGYYLKKLLCKYSLFLKISYSSLTA
jgi:hypothetical protein